MSKIVELLPPGALQQEQCIDGEWRLLRDYKLKIGGAKFVLKKGFKHNGSSWPRWLPGPAQARIMAAGAVHDGAFRFGTHGMQPGARKLTFKEANDLWYDVALSGSHPGARATKGWALTGWLGLMAFGYPTWRRYRNQDAD